ncbi:MAG TPA: sugar phosphate nucleotidyltransferase [bacterium]|nr:sugar phosphate nucleotidyltransferase [bacterium]
MNAIIPVAGRGTRLRPHTHTQPKVLMNVAGKPILAYILDELRGLGVEEVTFIVGHLADQVEEYVNERYAFRAHFVHQEEPLGNGHAIYVAREHLTGPTLIVFGDTIVDADLRAVTKSPYSTIGVHHVDDPRAFGVVEVNGDGFVRHLWEKPERPPAGLSHIPDMAVVGVYMIREPRPFRAALEEMVARRQMAKGEYWLADALQIFIDRGGRLGTFPVRNWYDCGTPEALLRANHALLDAAPAPRRIDGTFVIPPSSIADTAVVDGSVIGPYVTIGEGAQVVNSILRESIVNAHAHVERVVLEHSIIGERATVKGRPARINIGDSSDIEVT